MRQRGLTYNCSIVLIIAAFLAQLILPAGVSAQTIMSMPVPGTMVHPTPGFVPATIKGVRVHPENPFQFDFIVHRGDEADADEIFQEESQKLIKYFLASLTVPEDDLWVNLSPYESDRIIPQEFGITEMGRDMLAQDYLLKQFTASLMYPENVLGAAFWERVYKRAHQLYGTSNIPINTFNKIWILPEKAVVYENGNSAFLVETKLKVMLEEDYLAMKAAVAAEAEGDSPHSGTVPVGKVPAEVEYVNNVTSEVVKEVLIPEIEKEVNEGKHFAPLRQIFHSLILGTWYKENLQNTLINRKYSNQNKITGIDLDDKEAADKIYQQYLAAFKRGVYDYIKEDYDPVKQEIIPRKYFSGGVKAKPTLSYVTEDVAQPEINTVADNAMLVTTVVKTSEPMPQGVFDKMIVRADPDRIQENDRAMLAGYSAEFSSIAETVHVFVDKRPVTLEQEDGFIKRMFAQFYFFGDELLAPEVRQNGVALSTEIRQYLNTTPILTFFERRLFEKVIAALNNAGDQMFEQGNREFDARKKQYKNMITEFDDEFRRKIGLNIKDFLDGEPVNRAAERIGIASSTLHRIIKGVGDDISLPVLIKLANGIEQNIENIITGEKMDGIFVPYDMGYIEDNIGLNIERRRSFLGLKLTNLSDAKYGLNSGYISELEVGRRSIPNLVMLMKIAKAFNMSFEQLLRKNISLSHVKVAVNEKDQWNYLDEKESIENYTNLIRRLRFSRNLSQEKLAKQIGMEESSISDIENGNLENVQLPTVLRFVLFFDGSLFSFSTGLRMKGARAKSYQIEVVKENLGPNLKYARMVKGLTEPELAARIGGSEPNVIYEYESGKKTPSFSRLIALARALEVPPDVLIDSSERAKSFVDQYLAPVNLLQQFDAVDRDLVTLGHRLKDIRVASNKSMADIAEYLGTNVTFVWRMENAKLNDIPTEDLLKLADLYELDLFYLLSGRRTIGFNLKKDHKPYAHDYENIGQQFAEHLMIYESDERVVKEAIKAQESLPGVITFIDIGRALKSVSVDELARFGQTSKTSDRAMLAESASNYRTYISDLRSQAVDRMIQERETQKSLGGIANHELFGGVTDSIEGVLAGRDDVVERLYQRIIAIKSMDQERQSEAFEELANSLKDFSYYGGGSINTLLRRTQSAGFVGLSGSMLNQPYTRFFEQLNALDRDEFEGELKDKLHVLLDAHILEILIFTSLLAYDVDEEVVEANFSRLQDLLDTLNGETQQSSWQFFREAVNLPGMASSFLVGGLPGTIFDGYKHFVMRNHFLSDQRKRDFFSMLVRGNASHLALQRFSGLVGIDELRTVNHIDYYMMLHGLVVLLERYGDLLEDTDAEEERRAIAEAVLMSVVVDQEAFLDPERGSELFDDLFRDKQGIYDEEDHRPLTDHYFTLLETYSKSLAQDIRFLAPQEAAYSPIYNVSFTSNKVFSTKLRAAVSFDDNPLAAPAMRGITFEDSMLSTQTDAQRQEWFDHLLEQSSDADNLKKISKSRFDIEGIAQQIEALNSQAIEEDVVTVVKSFIDEFEVPAEYAQSWQSLVDPFGGREGFAQALQNEIDSYSGPIDRLADHIYYRMLSPDINILNDDLVSKVKPIKGHVLEVLAPELRRIVNESLIGIELTLDNVKQKTNLLLPENLDLEGNVHLSLIIADVDRTLTEFQRELEGDNLEAVVRFLELNRSLILTSGAAYYPGMSKTGVLSAREGLRGLVVAPIIQALRERGSLEAIENLRVIHNNAGGEVTFQVDHNEVNEIGDMYSDFTKDYTVRSIIRENKGKISGAVLFLGDDFTDNFLFESYEDALSFQVYLGNPDAVTLENSKLIVALDEGLKMGVMHKESANLINGFLDAEERGQTYLDLPIFHGRFSLRQLLGDEGLVNSIEERKAEDKAMLGKNDALSRRAFLTKAVNTAKLVAAGVCLSSCSNMVLRSPKDRTIMLVGREHLSGQDVYVISNTLQFAKVKGDEMSDQEYQDYIDQVITQYAVNIKTMRESIENIKKKIDDPKTKIEVIGIEMSPEEIERSRRNIADVFNKIRDKMIEKGVLGVDKKLDEVSLLLYNSPVNYMRANGLIDEAIEILGLEDNGLKHQNLAAVSKLNNHMAVLYQLMNSGFLSFEDFKDIISAGNQAAVDHRMFNESQVEEYKQRALSQETATAIGNYLRVVNSVVGTSNMRNWHIAEVLAESNENILVSIGGAHIDQIARIMHGINPDFNISRENVDLDAIHQRVDEEINKLDPATKSDKAMVAGSQRGVNDRERYTGVIKSKVEDTRIIDPRSVEELLDYISFTELVQEEERMVHVFEFHVPRLRNRKRGFARFIKTDGEYSHVRLANENGKRVAEWDLNEIDFSRSAQLSSFVLNEGVPFKHGTALASALFFMAGDQAMISNQSKEDIRLRLEAGEVVRLKRGDHVFLANGETPVIIPAGVLEHARIKHQHADWLVGSKFDLDKNMVSLIREALSSDTVWEGKYGYKRYDFKKRIGVTHVINIADVLGVSVDEAIANGWASYIEQSGDGLQGHLEIYHRALPSEIKDKILPQPTGIINFLAQSFAYLKVNESDENRKKARTFNRMVYNTGLEYEFVRRNGLIITNVYPGYRPQGVDRDVYWAQHAHVNYSRRSAWVAVSDTVEAVSVNADENIFGAALQFEHSSEEYFHFLFSNNDLHQREAVITHTEDGREIGQMNYVVDAESQTIKLDIMIDENMRRSGYGTMSYALAKLYFLNQGFNGFKVQVRFESAGLLYLDASQPAIAKKAFLNIFHDARIEVDPEHKDFEILTADLRSSPGLEALLDGVDQAMVASQTDELDQTKMRVFVDEHQRFIRMTPERFRKVYDEFGSDADLDFERMDTLISNLAEQKKQLNEKYYLTDDGYMDCSTYCWSVEHLFEEAGFNARVVTKGFPGNNNPSYISHHSYIEVDIGQEAWVVDLTADQFEFPTDVTYIPRYQNLGVVMLPKKYVQEHRERFWMYETEETTDQAMITDEEVGGIDFTKDQLKLDVRRDENADQFQLDLNALENIQIDGLIPVIINITPVTNLPLILGMNGVTQEAQETQRLSSIFDPKARFDLENLIQLSHLN